MFTDAQAIHQQRPDTFDVPSPERLAAIKPGWFVKVCAPPERFWVLVESRNDNNIVGSIDNCLFDTDQHGLRWGDSIRLELRHVYDAMSPNDE